MKFLAFSQTKSGSNDLLCAHGWAGQAQRLLSWRRFSQSEIRNSAAAEKSESESEGGQKFLPPNPLPFCPPERSVSAARSAAISRSSAQNRFELRSVIATNSDILKIDGHLVARSPRLRRVSLRKKPCISELNRKVGQIQIQFFGKANGGSFQFFPSMILFHKNHWTKQVFRRGERFLSSFVKVQSNCFPFAQNQTFFC